MARIHFINNNGGGFADTVEVPEGTSIAAFLQQQGITNPADYNIRVNRMPVAANTLLNPGDRVSAVPVAGTRASSEALQAGDRISVTPKKIAGAAA